MLHLQFISGTVSLLLTLLLFSGCQVEEPVAIQPVEPPAPSPISILFVDVPNIGEQVARRWSAETGGDVKFADTTAQEFADEDYVSAKQFDLVVYPAPLLGDLISADLLSEIPDAAWNKPALECRGLLRHNRNTLSNFGRSRYAIPISNPHFMALIRTEILADKEAAPGTWERLLTVAQQAEGDTGLDFEFPIAIPTAKGWAAKSYLAVAACVIRQRGNLNTLFNRRNMKPLLTTKPFVSSLELLKEIVGGNGGLSPAEVLQQYVDEKTAIAIGWSNKNFLDDGVVETKAYNHTRVCRLPGTKKIFDSDVEDWTVLEGDPYRVEFTGFSATQFSMLNSATHPMDVYQFMGWFGGKQTTDALMSGSQLGSPTRPAHLGNIQNWIGDFLNQETVNQYSDLLSEASESPTYLTFPRIPGSVEYWTELDNAIQRFLSDELDAASALSAAAEKWEEITELYGRENQIEMLRKDDAL